MFIPEWEMEEIIVAHPELLEVGPNVSDLKILAQQFYLQRCGGYLDVLASFSGGFLVVELKNERIDDERVITDQLAKYVKELTERPECQGNVKSLLVSTEGFSNEVEEAARAGSVALQTLPVDRLVMAAFRGKMAPHTMESAEARLLQRRLRASSLRETQAILLQTHKGDKNIDASSVIHFIESGRHDEHGLRRLAAAFREISKHSPIMAHSVFSPEDGKLQTNEDKWFWLFYSVLDRRANAATFINARHALERYDLFLPHQLSRLVEAASYETAIRKVLEILKKSAFPVVSDSVRRDLAMPSSIVDAAVYLKRFGYFLDQAVDHFICKAENNPKACEMLMKDLRANIYGVGPRIAAQIVRGLALKGGLDLCLSGKVQLERCSFNEFFAGPARLGLITSPQDYETNLADFAARYLEGNCGIISHILWYIRKRFCLRLRRCEECPVAGFCCFFREKLLRRPEYVQMDHQLKLFNLGK